jgi:hypothetical protein
VEEYRRAPHTALARRHGATARDSMCVRGHLHASGAGLGSPQQKASPVTHNKGAAAKAKFVVAGNAKETFRSAVTLARDRVQVGGIFGGKALEGRK